MSPPRPGSDRSTARLWLLAALPLALLAVLVAAILRLEPARELRGPTPPVEVLAIERVQLSDEGLTVHVVNDGPDPVRIAQVMIDEAYWLFSQHPSGPLTHLGRARLEIPYPWVEGEAHEIRLVSSTGVTFDHSVEVALATPKPSGRYFLLFALVGLYVGVLPVALGLLWFPLVRRLGSGGRDFVLALTVGLLLFLLVDTVEEGLEVAGEMAGSYQGVALLVFAALAAYLGIEALGARLRERGARTAAWSTALMVAVGIGLHNFAEGLAIGAAFSLGEVALGTLLVLGFTLHNTTEGLAIVAPLADARPGLARLALLGAVAGVPTIGGAWLGGLAYSRFWSIAFLGVGAGAIAQVVVQIVQSSAGERQVSRYLATGRVAGGLLLGAGIMYLTGMLVG